MTNTRVSPSAAAPVRRRDLAGNAHAQPTATASAAFARKNPNPAARHPLPTAPRQTKITLAPLTRPASTSESQQATQSLALKSP
jgi:hypothetical protein